eukprot:CAMPEP_0168218960 /NCGR_PEP_ID=MMETSP0140_2-20121125/8242_1 /TAXON_ID=44445 /ORGANISM="Pseudo-nitzschia australis, Strain 10249 10 AB" /LENGTH=76 /DNA_ID=CAMNT_0008147183 /DNA_START=914 /DNA_END=1140 /DNA_ORIENTATION=-
MGKYMPTHISKRFRAKKETVSLISKATIDMAIARTIAPPAQKIRATIQGFTVDSLDEAMNDLKQDRAVCVSKIETA